MPDINIETSQSLSPDAEVTLFRLITRGGTSIYFKSGPEVTYLGNTYESVPCALSAEKKSAEGNPERPTLSIGGDDSDLILLKPALFSGEVDGGTLEKYLVELDDLKEDNDVKIETRYRIKQVQDYNRYKINLVLARFTPSASTTIPYVKYLRPAYPYVDL